MELYKITNSYQQLVELLDGVDLQDEMYTDYKEFLDSIKDDLKEKAINIGSLIRNFESEEEAIENAIKEMQIRQLKLAKKIHWLRNYLKENLERCEIKKVNSPYFDIKVKVNPASVLIENASIIPSEYFKEIVSKLLDRKTIAEKLKNNIMIPGVSLEKRTRLEIK